MFSGIKSLFAKTVEHEEPVFGFFQDTAPSWEDLGKLVQEKQPNVGSIVDRTDLKVLETGPATAQAMRRTFGSTRPIRVKLYRDHASWCPYCHKVWLQLEEKRIPYIIEKINMRCYGDKPNEFLAKVPSGLLPAMELDGRVITESAQIMSILEKEFPERPLLPPAGTTERECAP